MSVGQIPISARFSALIAVIVLQIGCSSQSVDRASCDKADWYGLGRTDGAQGAPGDRLAKHRDSCGRSFNSDWETLYLNGRNAGLVEFCEAKNAFEMGKMGVTYFYVCPSTVEPEFIAEYRKGQAARELELQNKKLDLEIDQLSQKMVVASSKFEQRQIASELEQLKKTRTKNERELDKNISK